MFVLMSLSALEFGHNSGSFNDATVVSGNLSGPMHDPPVR